LKTIIAIVLDRSGSMAGRESDVIQGVNGFVADQQTMPDPAMIALARFDTEAIERFRPLAPLSAFVRLTALDYQPRGGTPLLDAVGDELGRLENDWRTERPDRCVMVIATDGQENSSRRHTKAQIKQMIQARQESGKWAFIYLGANVDSFAEASAMGIWASNTANYKADSAGIAGSYTASSNAVKYMRATGQTVASNLGGNIKADGTVDKIAPEPPVWTEPASSTWTPPA